MKYLKEYAEYILEFRKIMTKRSASGSTREFDVVIDDPTSALSPSAGVLLRKKLADEEFQGMLDDKDFLQKTNIDDIDPKRLRFEISKNNAKFLESKKSLGELRCEYCKKGPLKVYGFHEKFNKINGATADHRTPMSKGGAIFDFDNLAVCCHKCNQEKRNRDYDDWMDIISKR